MARGKRVALNGGARCAHIWSPSKGEEEEDAEDSQQISVQKSAGIYGQR